MERKKVILRVHGKKGWPRHEVEPIRVTKVRYPMVKLFALPVSCVRHVEERRSTNNGM